MRCVLVTGASRGIGREVAQAFAELGDRVAVHYSASRAGAERTAAQLPGDGHAVVAGDLADPLQARQIVADAIAALGRVDVLINNAGIAPTVENAHRIAEVDFERWCAAWTGMVDVNLLGTANVTWAAARHMIEHGSGGRIINVGSRGAFVGEPDHPAYAASKAAMHAMSQSLALALAPHNIAVSAIAPGFVATERQQVKLDGAQGAAIRGQSPFARVGTTREIASGIVYLASADAEWASGAILDLNGASYLRT
ncbi:3-oxoacyl-[acyl-carrier protein] reductase [Mycolicibacterium sp. 624]